MTHRYRPLTGASMPPVARASRARGAPRGVGGALSVAAVVFAVTYIVALAYLLRRVRVLGEEVEVLRAQAARCRWC